jgi:hypothetical protein
VHSPRSVCGKIALDLRGVVFSADLPPEKSSGFPKGKPINILVIMTSDRANGSLHIGQLAGSLRYRLLATFAKGRPTSLLMPILGSNATAKAHSRVAVG